MKKSTPVDIVFSVLKALISRRFLMIALFLAVFPFIVYGAKESWEYLENNVTDWIPEKFEETKLLKEFGRIFNANEVLVISWDDCTLDSPQLKEFQEKLRSPQPTSSGEELVLFREVDTGKDFLDKLSENNADPKIPDNMKLTESEIIERMKGFLISTDYSKTCLIAMLSEDGRKNRTDAINGLWKIGESVGLDMSTFHAAGPSLDPIAINNICRTYLVEMNLASYIIGIIISFLCFRSWRAAITVFLVSFMNQQMCLALIYWLNFLLKEYNIQLFGLNFQFDSILMLSVNLTFVLSMSAGIHLTNYYRDAISRLDDPRDAMFSALKTALVPTFISIITTIAGLMSFMNSQLVPIRKFGVVSSVALAISVCVILIFLPIYYNAFPITSWKNAKSKNSKWELANILERGFYPWVSRSPYMVLTASLIIAVVCLFGAANIITSIGLHSMLRSHTQPIRDYTWVEDQFGPIIPVEVMFTWPQGEKEQIYDRLAFIRDVTNKLKSEIKDVGIISITNFIPDFLPPKEARADYVSVKSFFNKKVVDSAKDGFTKSGYFKEQDGKQYWRITVRTYAMRRVDYGPIIQQINQIVEDEIKQAKEQTNKPGSKAASAPADKASVSTALAAEDVCVSVTTSSSEETTVRSQADFIKQELNRVKANADKFTLDLPDTSIWKADAEIEAIASSVDGLPNNPDSAVEKTEQAVEKTEQQTEAEKTQPLEDALPDLSADNVPPADNPTAPDSQTVQTPSAEETPSDSLLNSDVPIPVDDDANAAILGIDAADINVDFDADENSALLNNDPAAISVDADVNQDLPAEATENGSADNAQSTSQQTTTSKKKAFLPLTMPEYIVTGGVPVFYKAQNQLLADLRVSFLTAFLIIGLILVCLFRSLRCGILAVYPSLLPVIFVFGIVGWSGLRVEIGTMLTGSAALGIAVDNTVHFITWYRIGHQRGMDRKGATQLAYRKCGSAMFQTSSVCSLGLVTYMVSPFIPTIYFSFFMCALLFSALFSDLTVLPAILLSRWGKIFLRSVKPADSESTPNANPQPDSLPQDKSQPGEEDVWE